MKRQSVSDMKDTVRAIALLLGSLVSHDYNGRKAQSKDKFTVGDCDWVVDVSCNGSVSIVSVECSRRGSFVFFYGNTSGKPGHFATDDVGVPEIYASLPGLIQQLRSKSPTVDRNIASISRFFRK